MKLAPSRLETARCLKGIGVSSIPCDSRKCPVVPESVDSKRSWKPFQDRLPTDSELDEFFSGDASLAIVAGEVQCIDVDCKHQFGIWGDYKKRCEDLGLKEVLDKCIVQRTQNGGYHLIFRCEARMRNLKLAKNEDKEVILETRGDGGYFLAYPSSGYELERGSFDDIPTLSEDERNDLLAVARTFDKSQQKEPRQATHGTDLTPGDAFDEKAEIELPLLLSRHGWSQIGDSKYWTRPGKKNGVSASWGHIPGRFWVFTTSSEFEAEHVYRPWHVFAHLEHGGDFAAAARDLLRKGYGEKPRTSERMSALDRVKASVASESEEEQEEEEIDKLRRLLRERRFDQSKKPPPLKPIFTLAGTPICTPGNLTTITAQVKAGKSAFCSAIISATMEHPDADSDFLGVSGPNYEEKGMIYIDTEQAPDDFWHLVDRAKRRAKTDTAPDWIHAHCIADLGPDLARASLQVLLEDVSKAHNGVFAVIVDGVADLVHDVNDPKECNALVTELHSSAIKYDCAILCVIHLNALTNKSQIAKATGHLGSRLEKKAESNLKLEKTDEITVVWSDKQRRSPIFKNQGPRFKWNDELKMHATVEASAGDDLSMTDITLLEVLKEVFESNDSLRYADLIEGISTTGGWNKKPTGERKVARAVKKEFVKKDSSGFYIFNWEKK